MEKTVKEKAFVVTYDLEGRVTLTCPQVGRFNDKCMSMQRALALATHMVRNQLPVHYKKFKIVKEIEKQILDWKPFIIELRFKEAINDDNPIRLKISNDLIGLPNDEWLKIIYDSTFKYEKVKQLFYKDMQGNEVSVNDIEVKMTIDIYPYETINANVLKIRDKQGNWVGHKVLKMLVYPSGKIGMKTYTPYRYKTRSTAKTQ